MAEIYSPGGCSVDLLALCSEPSCPALHLVLFNSFIFRTVFLFLSFASFQLFYCLFLFTPHSIQTSSSPFASFFSLTLLPLAAPLLTARHWTDLVPDPPRGADSQPLSMSVCPPVYGQISLSSELQPGSLPPDADADESSSDMLVIVDDPVSSAPQSRATNSPASISGSVSDNMNGENRRGTNMFASEL